MTRLQMLLLGALLMSQPLFLPTAQKRLCILKPDYQCNQMLLDLPLIHSHTI